MSQGTNTAKTAALLTVVTIVVMTIAGWFLSERQDRPLNLWRESAEKVRDLSPSDRLMALYDFDGNSKLSVEEIRVHMDEEIPFPSIDQDGDGQIDSIEFTALLWRETPMRPHRKGRSPKKIIPRWEDWVEHAKRSGVQNGTP